MGEQLWEMIQAHPQKGDWKKSVMAWGLMLNSSSHPDGYQAVQMVTEDVACAYEHGVPTDIIKFALEQVYELRKIQLKAQGRRDGEIVRGEITPEIIKEKLRGKISQKYFDNIFS